ncbi:MAG: serine hydrolase [Herbaspirillum sp.]
MTLSFSRRDFLGATLCGAVSACGGGKLDSSGPVPEAQITGAISQIDSMAAALMTRTGVPGVAVAVVRETPNGIQTVYAKGFGNRIAGVQGAVDADTVFQLASMSKSIGATVVAHQVGLGNISWNTPVQQYLPWFALSDPAISAQLTVGDMYAHRSGLPGQAGDLLEEVGFYQLEILEKLSLLKLDPAPFRTKYAYSNFGMTTGGMTVAAAAQPAKPSEPVDWSDQWAKLSDEVLYQPLGMTRTSSSFPVLETRSNRAFPHVPISPKSTTWRRCEIREPDAQSPAAGVTSSVNDIGRWLAMLLGKGVFGGKQVVNGAALGTALIPQVNRPSREGAPASYYGYGFGISSTSSGRVTYSHSGAFILGVATSYMVVPSLGIAIVVLTNGYPQGVPETLIAQFFDLVEYGSYQQDWWAAISPGFVALVGPGGSLAGVPRPISPQPAGDLSAFTGTFKNAFYDELQVTQDNGVLVLTLGRKAHPMRLTHWDGPVFGWLPDNDGEDTGSLYKVEFSGAQVTLEYFNSDGMGTFLRSV